MKRIILPVLLLLATVMACEKYEKVPENDSFVVRCVVQDGTVDSGAPMTLTLLHGNSGGECTLSVSLKDKNSGGIPSYKILAEGKTSVSGYDTWSFDSDGKASFVITGLPSGSYSISVTVNRWYHSASGSAEFKIL